MFSVFTEVFACLTNRQAEAAYDGKCTIADAGERAGTGGRPAIGAFQPYDVEAPDPDADEVLT